MRRCSRCLLEKPLSEFHKGTRYRSYCKPCMTAYNNAQANRNIAIVRAAKDVPCADCGQRYHWFQMDFDHVRGQKSYNISRMMTMSEERLRAEIAKCDVVCSNCHRMRTFSRLETVRAA